MTSAYPVALDTLVERVKSRAVELGEVPSRNRIKTEFKVGAPKASAVLAELEATGFDPTRPDTPTQPLHVVRAGELADPDPAGGPAADVVTQATGTVASPADQVGPVPVLVDLPASDVAGVSLAAPEVTTVTDPGPVPVAVPARAGVRGGGEWSRTLPLLVIAAGAFVSIWSGWVGLGEKSGFGLVRLLPGIADEFVINSAITLPLGMEAYAAFALRVWLTGGSAAKGRGFAKWSAIGALVLGGLGQIAYHLMTAAGITVAPWWITTFVSCLPVAVLGCAAALLHLRRESTAEEAGR
ncbi:hypothetical protein [Actinokineospora enzanensis]|uniref:hypothetical protein n=1 Tax=Actinokineospora enzanensis TaxID=155975 RepID=UPI00037642CD|nr:hypothetical protein [Actinokineospora enzanensis]